MDHPHRLEFGDPLLRRFPTLRQDREVRAARTRCDRFIVEFENRRSPRDCHESVFGRAHDHFQAMARVRRSPKRTANCALAIAYLRGGVFHAFSEQFKARKRSFSATSSVGKCPLALTGRLSLEFGASMALVV